MRIGVMSGAYPAPEGNLDELVERAKDLEKRGFPTMWVANIFGVDAITVCAVLGRETRTLELGTAVVPSYPRHPAAIAQQALTAQAACGGRFTLGIGLSHQMIIENMMGLSYEKPARHMREYMEVLAPLARGDAADFDGDQYRVHMGLDVPGAQAVPVLIAALGERMLEIAGRTSDGTILWMTGPRTVESHIAPRLRAAAQASGRTEPRIVSGLPIVATSNAPAVRETIAKMLESYGSIPSYRAMLDREGVAGPAEIALVGDEKALDAELNRLRSLGVTDLDAVIVPAEDGADERTLDYLQSWL